MASPLLAIMPCVSVCNKVHFGCIHPVGLTGEVDGCMDADCFEDGGVVVDIDVERHLVGFL